jgi:hypothetical protein
MEQVAEIRGRSTAPTRAKIADSGRSGERLRAVVIGVKLLS